MTALSTPRAGAVDRTNRLGRLPGFGGLVRKEITEWRRSRRIWVVFLVSALFMIFSTLNSWLQANLPADPGDPAFTSITDPMQILVTAVSTQIFAVAAVFGVMGLLVAERESGTLAWTASKPVSRSAIWLSKYVVSTSMLWIAAGLLPVLATVAMVVPLYGEVPVLPVAIMAIATGLSIALFVAVALVVSTLVTSQAAVAAVAIGVMFSPQLLGLVLPTQFLPTSILTWSLMAAAGEPAGIVTPVAWAVTIAALVAYSLRQMRSMEL
jgi:ABC-type transport system involved in multi-copper enzyme maturation permease subunit